MTDRFYSAPFDAPVIGKVTQGSSTAGGSVVELRITYDAAGNSRMGVLKALKAIEHAVTHGTWPPV